MTFDSLDFLIFFAVIYSVWFFLRAADRKIRNSFLLLASYFFYGYWSPQFVLLLMTSTLVDFYLGRAIHKSDNDRTRKQLVGVSVAVNLSILGFFKYFNFFVDTAVMMLPEGSFMAPALKVILPVGISFYTFQSMSYSIDVYRGNIKPSDSLIDFALYVAFFPQLVAGPIERAGNMLPQFATTPRVAVGRTLDGLDLCIRGFFKKVVIADNVAPLVNMVYGDVDAASSQALWIGTYAFAIQIYADFSAYTDIARGSAKLLGFELMENFRSPYRSLNFTELWQRWHISLSTWFRDYLYRPLVSGGRRSRTVQLRSLFIVMALAGLWHGAAWNFVLWGLFHGLLLVLHSGLRPTLFRVTSGCNAITKAAYRTLAWFVTFHMIIISFVMFRAEAVADIGIALDKMLFGLPAALSTSGLNYIPNAGPGEQLFYVVIIIGMLAMQFSNLEERWKWASNVMVRGTRGAVTLAMLALLYPTVKEQFIYFQF
ncbi:MAG: MBOAT family protein [Gammaproteobacteria bacterium]|nr:MBOAT family protein [Gammaproteobacteria bacterium]NND53602.1 MBOAT family protein [Gammaproteobacteria bacterium]